MGLINKSNIRKHTELSVADEVEIELEKKNRRDDKKSRRARESKPAADYFRSGFVINFIEERKMEKKEVLIAIGIAGIVFYLLLITFLGFLWESYNPISQKMSELGAKDSPYKDIINYIGFSIFGIALMIFSLGFKYEFEENFNTEVSFYCFFVGGFFIFLVGFFPCDAGCLNLSPIGKLHFYVSAIPAILIPVAAIISSQQISKKWGKKWGNFSLYLGILSLISGPLMFLTLFTSYMGLIQRLGMGFSVLWIFMISTKFFIDKSPKIYDSNVAALKQGTEKIKEVLNR